MVLLTKENGDLWGIGIGIFFWKALSGVANLWIGVAVNFYDMLHGLCFGQGTSNLYL